MLVDGVVIYVGSHQETFRPTLEQALEAIERAKATFVMLVRDSDLYGAVSTVQQMEDRFNRPFEYPYVFLNDKPFSDSFKDSYPPWISQERAAQPRVRMKNVIYGSSESYRHMCRYQSGLLVQHQVMLPFDYYWRLEPDVKYSCDMDFDPFLYMQDNNKKYAFTISLYEYPETIQGLWDTTKDFMAKYPQLLDKNSAIDLISDDGGKTYNGCHFWSNFEIVDTQWMGGQAFQRYFRHLDQAGGFFYERWGDAPIHTIAAVLLLPVEEIHFFREIGYYHPPFHNCPAEPELQFLEMTKEKSMVYPEKLDDFL
ncbi:MAG: nucleotide-diphospho-sugar transferase [Benniella sp.]|nr:MAG: nucleotide-diphospho-sugar transferase [Benniella sp.]